MNKTGCTENMEAMPSECEKLLLRFRKKVTNIYVSESKTFRILYSQN